MAMRPANSNGDDDLLGGVTCRIKDGTAQRRFVAAFMALSAADDMRANGDVLGCIAGYRQAIEICPPCPERGDFYNLLGAILFEHGDAAASIPEFRAALSHDCKYPHEALRRLGFAHAATGDYAAALAAMTEALAAEEDVAFATQALLTFELAQNGLDAALQRAERSMELGESGAEYRCRLALVRAELHRLAFNRPAALAELSLAAELGKQDALDAELALWLGTLDRHFGALSPRPEVAAAFAAESDHWAALAWRILQGEGDRDDLVRHLASSLDTLRAENLAIFDRYAGMLALAAGDIEAARTLLAAARTAPHARWCADYHLAGIELLQLDKTIKL